MRRALRRRLEGLPVLVLHGADDSALGVELLTGIEAAAPEAEVHLLSNCSHWIQQDYPGQTNDIIRGWLERNGLQRSASAAGVGESGAAGMAEQAAAAG
jgi:pimeloyl-ACP methyl ester carboxylesterase